MSEQESTNFSLSNRSQCLVAGGTYANVPPVWADFYDLIRQSGFPLFPMVTMYRHQRHHGKYPYVVTISFRNFNGLWYGCPTDLIANDAYEMACDLYLST